MDDKGEKRQVYELRARIDRLESQKNILLKELDINEERFEKNQRLYSRFVPLIIDLVTEKNRGVAFVLKDLSAELKKNASTERIEGLFQKFHQAILNEDPEVDRGKDKPFFSSLFKGSSDHLMKAFKQGYLDIIDTLNGTLESSHWSALNQLSDRIVKVSDLESMGKVRDELFHILHGHITDIGRDREKLAIFVKDIVRQILGMEEIIRLSFDHFGAMLEPGDAFDLVLKNEIDQARKTLDIDGNLEEVKARLASSFATIEGALKQKVIDEAQIKGFVTSNHQTFETEFEKLRTELVQATAHSRELERKINQDPLTGAYNRRAYNQRIEDEMDRFLRYGTLFSLLFIDADHFKNINDTYGHAIGDKCLQEIIKRASKLIRKSDMLARYGGEEFVLVMPETDAANAKNVAEKIRKTIERIAFLYKKDAVKVTVSIGVTQVRENDAVPQDVLGRADAAVYQAKQDGRNRVVLN
ncbi:signal transduction family protein (GGDEF domain protein) [Desulforapulum autotrophicum HRM2]|uniref:diguanylate cyclase n=1 Tax=Desulforapulum autotrophicum (strain ATCC 43914 / DSM 3382 / VKM B-1955 / HRM2) TaxID=177437 RepID=C0QJ78_DESAH|nr:GGDEF domain-containing protein [Desulforapulum autotrophicum]ACN15891.1 signal transduction family protein (GGDEF domain protein) [Desulforapulum autotrophicum HRM2]